MHDEHPHPLLAQVPLTVSPFLALPTATPLPYSYRQLPSTLPPSILSGGPASNQSSALDQPAQQAQQQQQSPAYITSSTGITATPDQILASCHALQAHLAQLETNARSTLKEWEDKRMAADLAEKRRVAPGWLDGDVKLLVPENVDKAQGQEAAQDVQMGDAGEQRHQEQGKRDGVPDSREGEELDRVFGGLDLK